MSSAQKRKRKSKAESPPPEPEIRAAGGLVWRATFVADGEGEPRSGVEIVVVHRPRYDDWSFPKGKLDKGETYEEAAVREVAEETGLVCELGDELPSTWYLDGKGRLKLVRYWAMRVVGIEPIPVLGLDREQIDTEAARHRQPGRVEPLEERIA